MKKIDKIDRASRDQETIRKLDIALNKALDEITELHKNNNHRILVLQAEVRARSAAAAIMQQEKDAIEFSLREAQVEIDRLKKQFGQAGTVRWQDPRYPEIVIRQDAETDPAVPGERRDVTPTTSA